MSSILPAKLIGRGGIAGYAPENTLASLHTAADMAVDWVLLDVRMTADKIPVLIRDADLLRTTGTAGRVADMTYDRLQELDAGSWFAESFLNERIPTLEDAVDVILARGLHPLFVLHPETGGDVDMAEAVFDTITRVWPDEADAPKPAIASYSYVCLETCLDMLPSWHRCLMLDHDNQQAADAAAHIKAHSILLPAADLTRDRLEDVIELGKPVLIDTVNDSETARMLLRWGADSLVSDTPDRLREALEPLH